MTRALQALEGSSILPTRTMGKTIYLTGAVSDWDEPFAWHDELMDSNDWEDTEFVNPYTVNDFELGDDQIYEEPEKVVEPALDALVQSDGVLVRWDDDAFLVGTSIEMRVAKEHDIPVVVWYDGWRDDLSPWIQYHTKGSFENKEKALKVLLTFTGTTFAIRESFE